MPFPPPPFTRLHFEEGDQPEYLCLHGRGNKSDPIGSHTEFDAQHPNSAFLATMDLDRAAKLEQLMAITATMPDDRHGRSSMEEILRDNDWDVEVGPGLCNAPLSMG